jgi:hypothetical protein
MEAAWVRKAYPAWVSSSWRRGDAEASTNIYLD